MTFLVDYVAKLGGNRQLKKKIHNFLSALLSYQAPVVQTLDSTIHQLNHYPAEKYQGKQHCIIGWIEIYPVDNVIHPFNYWCYIGILRSKAKVITCWTFTCDLQNIRIFPVKVLLWMFTSCKRLQPFLGGTLIKQWQRFVDRTNIHPTLEFLIRKLTQFS